MSLSLLDWRRAVADLYRQVRADPTPEQAWERWRNGRERLLLNHVDSPLQPGADPPSYAPYDPDLRFEPAIEETPPERWEATTATDGVVPFARVGKVHLPDIGSLDVWWLDSYGGGIFVPLRDTTSGKSTYGGGRYLVDTVKGADLGGTDGRLVIDLNFAYNPSCAYDAAWACPLAPLGNRVDTAINAGELSPAANFPDAGGHG